jgi:hypothetical protein
MSWRERLNLTNVVNFWTIFGPGGVLAVILSWVAEHIGPIAELGWGAAIFVGIAATCFIMLMISALLVSWRYFHPLPQEEKVAAPPDAPAKAQPSMTDSKNNGVEFFANRNLLQRAHGTLGSRFAGATKVSAILVVGHKFYISGDKIGAVKELLLPDPDGKAIKRFAETTERKDTTRAIKEVTRIARKNGAAVRWYDHFVCHSVLLVDVEKPTGWVHVEMVLPYSTHDKRPSYTLYKNGQEEAVLEMSRVFREIWDNAHEPRL